MLATIKTLEKSLEMPKPRKSDANSFQFAESGQRQGFVLTGPTWLSPNGVNLYLSTKI